MRPGDFSPGNPSERDGSSHRCGFASMRPGDFSPGNPPIPGRRRSRQSALRFNEAGGFLPRKHGERGLRVTGETAASMRPGDFSPGNPLARNSGRPPIDATASMRPGDFSPGNSAVAAAGTRSVTLQ